MNSSKWQLLGCSLFVYVLTYLPFIEQSDVLSGIMYLIVIQVLWIGGVFPLALSSLILMLMLSTRFFTYEETLGYFSSEIVWLLFSTFILAGAFVESGLAARLSIQLLSFSRGSSRLLVFFSFFLMFILSLFIPSNIGKASLVTSVLDSIVKQVNQMERADRLGKSLFIGLTLIVPISGAFVVTGASSTLYAYGLLTELAPNLDYIKWLVMMGPPILLFLLLLYGLFLLVFPPEQINREQLESLLEEKLDALGKMTNKEWKVLGVIGLTVLLWMTGSLHGFSVSLAALFGALLTMMPGMGIWSWEEARKKISWDLMLFFAATLMLSNMLIKTGAVKWFASLLVAVTPDSYFLAAFALLTVTALLRLFFVNVLGFLTIILPISIAVGEAFPEQHPVLLPLGVLLIGIPGFTLITQSPIHLISYEYGYFTKKDLFKAGTGASVIWLLVVFACLYGYWVFFY